MHNNGSERLKRKLMEIYGVAKYPAHAPQVMLLHDAPSKKAVAKLRAQVQAMREQINRLECTLDEL